MNDIEAASADATGPNDLRPLYGSLVWRFLRAKVRAAILAVAVVLVSFCGVSALLSDSILDSGAFTQAAQHYRQANSLGPEVEIELCGGCNSSMSTRGAVTTWKFVLHAELEQGTRRVDATVVHDEDSGAWTVSY